MSLICRCREDHNRMTHDHYRRETTAAKAPMHEPPGSSSKTSMARLLTLITTLLDHYWINSMSDAERKVILGDWIEALRDAPLDSVKKARAAWLVDMKRGHRAPKIVEFLGLVYANGRRRHSTLGDAPLELTPRTSEPWDKRSPAQKWSSYARFHAFFDVTGRTEPRPVDADMNFYDIDLVRQATAEAMIKGTMRAWGAMKILKPEATEETET